MPRIHYHVCGQRFIDALPEVCPGCGEHIVAEDTYTAREWSQRKGRIERAQRRGRATRSGVSVGKPRPRDGYTWSRDDELLRDLLEAAEHLVDALAECDAEALGAPVLAARMQVGERCSEVREWRNW